MKFILALLIFSFSSFACELTLPHKMIILAEEEGPSVFKSQDCSKELLSDLHQILVGVEGRMSSSQLAAMLSQRGHSSISIQPPMVQIRQFKNLLREQLNFPSGVQVKSTSGVNVPGVMALAPGDMMEIECINCLYGARQPLHVVIKGFDGTNRTFTAVVDFRRMVRAYRVTSSLASFSTIEPNQYLREVYIESIPHTDLITDLNSLKFYKTNKPIKAGTLLKASDLNALSLVKAGLKTEVILENQMIRIKTQGISRNNGSLGDIVEVFHPQKNRKYQGKVVDINKVLVEL
jgi:flagella basal body P-ring formation protein FlgA